jgi:hypothetical protein
MATCDELKKGYTLVCENCGLELQVTKQCADCDSAKGTCSAEACTFQCHGKPLKVKKTAGR